MLLRFRASESGVEVSRWAAGVQSVLLGVKKSSVDSTNSCSAASCGSLGPKRAFACFANLLLKFKI